MHLFYNRWSKECIFELWQPTAVQVPLTPFPGAVREHGSGYNSNQGGIRQLASERGWHFARWVILSLTIIVIYIRNGVTLLVSQELFHTQIYSFNILNTAVCFSRGRLYWLRRKRTNMRNNPEIVHKREFCGVSDNDWRWFEYRYKGKACLVLG